MPQLRERTFVEPCEERIVESLIIMSGAVFQMWMVLLLGIVTGVGSTQVSTAKVMRGNIRRDGKMFLFLCFRFCCCCACYCVFTVKTVSV